MGLAMRQVDLERLDRALTTLLSPLAHRALRRLASSRSSRRSRNCSTAITSCSGLPRAGVPMHVHSMNVAAQPQRRDPDSLRQTAGPAAGSLASGRGARAAAVECRGVEPARVHSGGPPLGSRRRCGAPLSSARCSRPAGCYDSENIDWPVADGHAALCISYSNTRDVRSFASYEPDDTRRKRCSELLLPALKVGVTMRLARDREVEADLTLGRFGLTRREAQIARLLARAGRRTGRSPISST